ncbi:MAG: hypothetical protein M3475_08785, partial [Actinomycetota bacterium]|nr:hypothetical protein [Actinomycetota bacterium]
VGTELDGITDRARLAGLSVGLLETTFDIDVAEDLQHLRPLALERSDLQATRETLESLGLIERDATANDEHDPAASGEIS